MTSSIKLVFYITKYHLFFIFYSNNISANP